MGLQTLLAELADDIDGVAANGGVMPYTGGDIRDHYDAIVSTHGLEIATADATSRYLLQVECAAVDDLPKLIFPVQNHDSLPTQHGVAR